MLVTILMPPPGWSPKKIDFLGFRMESGINRICKECEKSFLCCRRCWRGHKYCSLICRKKARGLKRRLYERKYSSTEAGLESRRKRQIDFRHRRKNLLEVTGHSMKLFSAHIKLSSTNEVLHKSFMQKCFRCGCEIKNVVCESESLFNATFISESEKTKDYFSFNRIKR